MLYQFNSGLDLKRHQIKLSGMKRPKDHLDHQIKQQPNYLLTGNLNMSIHELSELTKQYHTDTAELEKLNQGTVDVEQQLQTVENDTTIEYEAMAAQSVELNRQLEKALFQRKAITARLQTLRAEITDMIEVEQEAHKEAKQQAHRDRSALYQSIINSDEWKAIQHKMTALVALQGQFWDTVKGDLICREPSLNDAEQAARDLGLWIDDPEEPDEIIAAIHAVGLDTNDISIVQRIA